MSRDTVAFLPAKCNRTGKDFYIRFDFAADDVWTQTYGVKKISSSEKMSSRVTEISLSNYRVGPQYKCPHCGNKRIFFCRDCGVKACCYDGADTWTCPLTGKHGGFSKEGIFSITADGGSGQ